MELSTAQLVSALLVAVNLFFPESGNPRLQPPDTPQENVNITYDFIIVGAGSAGCVVANRLTENPRWKVLLIEAGGDEDVVSETPHLYKLLRNTEKDWNYTTIKQEQACMSSNGICAYPRGHVMGGSSTINGMMYVRGNPSDYDSWAADGNPGWSYQDVLPYFIKSENNTEATLQNSDYHGYKGYLNVQYPKYLSSLAPKIISAGKEFGWEEGDYNTKNQKTIGYVQYTLEGPSRESTSKAYLNPIRHRPNLNVIKHAQATKLLLDGTHIKGVQYYRNGKLHSVLAQKEVILSAGAIDTPKLLMLSGIGPKSELKKHGIPIKKNLPVGKHLLDHLLVVIYFKLNSNETQIKCDWRNEETIKEYARDRKGPLTTFGAESMVFLNIFNETELPNLQLIFSPSCTTDNKEPLLEIILSNVYPKSIGEVKLRSNNWTDPPLIDPNYFGEEVDLEVFERGFELLFDYMKTPTMKNFRPKLYSEHYPHCKELEQITKKYMRCIIQQYTTTIYHPVSTAKMGLQECPKTVVTPELLVKGYKNLRVIDASVMPYITRGNTNAPTIMIAEKGADLIKNNNK